jgi:hypothetical protein
MSIAPGFARASHRVERSTSRRPSISIVELGPRVDAVVERLDRGPELAHAEHLARDRVGAREIEAGAPVSSMQAERERRPGSVDELVGHDGRDDLAAQPVARICDRRSARQRRREVALEIVREVGSSGRSDSSSSAYRWILQYAITTASSGATSAPRWRPCARRSSHRWAGTRARG